jgi:flagellar biosynthesis anti-sigma factor FlgM
MRIDLNAGAQATAEADPADVQGGAGSSSSVSSTLAEDQAQLSGSHAQVETLAAEVERMPEVRQERVQALRQAVQSGQYDASPEKVAGAVFLHLIVPSAA